jgi:hypothetical protein
MGKRIPVSLIAALLALGMLAFGATSASATAVTPPEAEITATLAAGTTSKFLPANAYAETSVQCESSEAEFTTPNGEFEPGEGKFRYNTNRGAIEAVGAFSESAGSVIMDLTEPPTFNECFIYEWSGTAWVKNEEAPASVSTNNDNGDWTFAALQLTEWQGQASIGVPTAGAEIEIPALACTEVVSPTQASSVAAPAYVNETQKLFVDGQIDGSGCPLPTPAQFEAIYDLTETFRILP